MLLHKQETKHIIFILLLILIYIMVTLFSEQLALFYNPKNHLSFHVLLEMFIIIIAFAIALLAWTILKENLSRHRLYLGSLFFVVGFLELWHMLTYNGMPFFFTESSIARATWFWIITRFTESIGLLAIFLVQEKSITPNYRKGVFLVANIYVIFIVMLIETQIDLLPALVIEGQGTTAFKNSIEYVVIFLLLCTIILLLRRYRKDKQMATLYIISALELFILSEFTFTMYQSVNDITNILGHAYKVIGVYFLYKGIYVTTIEEPYNKKKQAERALKDSEQRYRSLVDVSPDAIVVHYNYQILYCNQNFVRLVKEERDLIGTTILSYVAKEDESKVRDQVTSLDEGGTFGPSERKYITAEGDEIYVEVKSARIRFQEKDAVIANLRDISDRKKLEWQIEESEMRYKSLFDYNQNASFVLNLEGSFININHVAEKLTGYSKNELIGSSWMLLISKDQLERTTHLLDKVMNGEAANFETTVITKNGCEVILYINSTPIIVKDEIIGIIGVAQDVTQQRLADQELAESEERYRKLIELYPDGLYVHNESHLLYINDTAVHLLGGKTKVDIGDKTIFDFIPKKRKPIVYYTIQSALNGQIELSHSYEMEVLKLNGEKLMVEIGAVTISYNGKPAILGSFRDITKRKEAEEKLVKANKLLKEFSNQDGLTDIANRRYFDQMLENEWKRALRHQRKLSLIMIDIDSFKQYNDTYGHLQGDECLKIIADAISKCLRRTTDFFSRYGGEEFSVILPEMDEGSAYKTAEMIRATVESLKIPHTSSKVISYITVSVGVATLTPTDDFIPTHLIEKADIALYKAKNTGRNKVEQFTIPKIQVE